MSKIEKVINRITEFGINDKVESDNKELEIQKLLVELYSEYLNLKTEFDVGDFEEEPTFEYDSIKKSVEANFPYFGWYHSVWESHKVIPDADLVTGDAIDDLTDIIKDLLEVKWCFENTTEKNAKWHFYDLMRIHSEQHLVNLLKYLKTKMANELPTLKSTDAELESIYDVHSKRFFHWLETNSISANSSRDIALLAHNELVKRSNNRFSRKSTILTYSVIALSVITLSFAFLDFVGDQKWQEKQITELELINKNLTERNTEIESLKLELEKVNKKILSLEQKNKSEKK